MAYKPTPISIRLEAKVDKRGPEECWPFTGALDRKGYGVIRLSSEVLMTGAHRAAYLAWVGPIQDGLFVLHRCDNPPCCNPRHLFLGTNQDNVNDMVAKGRSAKGPTSYGYVAPKGDGHWTRREAWKRLPPDAVSDIKTNCRRRKEDFLLYAKKYGKSVSTIMNIVYGRTWSQIA